MTKTISKHAKSKTAALTLVSQGKQFLHAGDTAVAENVWRKAIEVDPQCTAAWSSLTDLLSAGYRATEALLCLERWIAATDRTPENLLALAEKSCLLEQYDQGRTMLEEALALNPPEEIRPRVRLLFAKLDHQAENWDSAIERVNEILQSSPENAEAIKVRQQCWRALGYAAEDAADCRLLTRLRPNPTEHSDLIFNMLFLPETTPASLHEECARWSNLHAESLAKDIIPFLNSPDPDRRLRIGYVSPDFRHHPIMKLLPAVFERHDERHFEVFAYSISTRNDGVTDYVRGAVNNFIELPPAPDKIAARIRADLIDILIDLAGHTMPCGSLQAFAQKPAPVQVNWMGVHSTTGLATMDYFLGDPHMPAPATEQFFSEKVYRLSRVQYCYRAHGDPGVADPPSLRNGYITFGCINNPKKITRDVVKVWSVILHFHPGSKLLLKYKYLDREPVQRRLRRWFTEDGITVDRLLFEDRSAPLAYLAAMNNIDIALDPFPYNGGTTTLDTLWMGVPVVSLRGRMPVTCCGASFLSAVGLPIAGTVEEYVALAHQFVGTISTTPDIRQRIRNAMLNSPLMDEQGFVRDLESAYREMWRRWCCQVAAPARNRKADALGLVIQGKTYFDRGDLHNAEHFWRGALQLDSLCVSAWSSLTDLLASTDRHAEAIDCLERVIAVTERTAENLYALGDKSCFLKKYDWGRKLLNDSRLLQPSPDIRAKTELLLAKLDVLDENWEQAFPRANQILDHDPDHLEALKIRQKCWQHLYYAAEDVADCRRLLAHRPNAQEHSDLIFKSIFLPETTPESLYAESRRWNSLYAEPLAACIRPHTNSPDPERRLKVGYISPDFRNHAIMKLLPAVFEHHDERHFELFAYSINVVEDDVTGNLRTAIRNFVDLPSNRDLIVDRVRSDNIDILVDLAGRTHPLDAFMVFALKPAPVQVSWMGIHSTTGLSTMDYFLGDAHMPCPGTEHLFTEKVHRLQHAQYCYRPFLDPGLAPSPCLANGYVTFGCFNNPAKITRDVVKLWAVLLHLHPTSRLLLKYKFLDTEIARKRLLDWFIQDGISATRVTFEGQSDALAYLASWNRVDIALDPFPYNGGTTTLDAMYMGVPVVSLRGRMAVSCCGASFLSAVGLPVAASQEQYIALANQLIASLPTAPELRVNIRGAMLKSPLVDERGLMVALEFAYRSMWRTWCAAQKR